jgi:hypothetical protein
LFGTGPERVCWLSLLNESDTFFSIERQWQHKVGNIPGALGQADKQWLRQRIYELGGGHARLTQCLSHLASNPTFIRVSAPAKFLEDPDLRSACEAIWEDLAPGHKDLLIEVVKGEPAAATETAQTLKNYGILKEQGLFPPLFAAFVLEKQAETGQVRELGCDEKKTRIVIQTTDRELSFPLTHFSPKKEIILPETTRNLLCYLLKHHDEVCPKVDLIQVGWPHFQDGGLADQPLEKQIERLRSWLSKEQKQLSEYIEIENVRKVGYRLVVKG